MFLTNDIEWIRSSDMNEIEQKVFEIENLKK